MNRLYSYYCVIIFSILFLISYPIQLVFIQKEEWYKFGHKLNQSIIKIAFFFCFIKVDITNKKIIEKNKLHVFCANHSSYIDILAMYLISDKYFKYLGKDSLEKIPLFGYMYKRLYITVNRKNKDSRTNALEECERTLQNGLSIAIYPEGAIPVKTPKLIHFKDGAFKLSIENNVPIIPITMPFNHLVLPVGGMFNSRSRHIKIIIHQPLNTTEQPVRSIKALKDLTYNVISDELKKYDHK